MAQDRIELKIRGSDLADILRRCREGFPQEVCGIMVGKKDGRSFLCDHVLPEENADASPYGFRIKPEELLKVYRHADEVGMELVGIYHSHPAPPSPSNTDLGFMKWSAPVWLIVSNVTWEYAAFRLEEGRPVRVEISAT